MFASVSFYISLSLFVRVIALREFGRENNDEISEQY